MDLGWIVAASGFAFAMAVTPGPTNTMLTASGANYGFQRSLPHLLGGALGVAVIIATVGAAGSALVADSEVRAVLKWVGLVYLLWLAWKTASARPMATIAMEKRGSGGKPLTLLQGALFQLVNPKIMDRGCRSCGDLR